MANSDRRAALKGVNDLGDLVLEADGEIFLLEADESVERAVLSAAQIRRENEEKPEAKQSGPLPISAIQALIRSGASVSQTARDFSIDDALVRRFAKPVETEKQYAIEQFLQAACPADTRGRTIQEVIFDTLSSTRANAKTIEWTAVRRNREPWRIKATFEVNEKITRAEFSWNMRANAVICLNTPAKLLLRQIQPESINLAGSPLAAAMGYSGVQFDPDGVDISFRSVGGEILVCQKGHGLEFDEELAARILTQDEVEILCEMTEGDGEATCWGCDLTYDYVKINGDYRS